MKSLFWYLSLFLLLSLSGSSYAQLTIKDGTNPIPDFKFYTLDGKEYTDKDFHYEQFGLIIYYSPKCGHCVDQAKEMKKSWDKFKNIKILWVAQNINSNIKAFKDKYFKDDKNCTFVNDIDRTLFSKFIIDKAPTIFIYNAERKLIATASENPASDIYQFWTY